MHSLSLGCFFAAALGAASCDSPSASPSAKPTTSPVITSPPSSPPSLAPTAVFTPAPLAAPSSAAARPIPPAPSLDPTRQALGLPLPKTSALFKRQIDTPYEQAFLTSLTITDLLAFVSEHFPTYTITHFPTGSFRATPPNEDGVEVSVTYRDTNRRIVSYRIVYPPDAPARELDAIQRAEALHAQGLGAPVVRVSGPTDDFIPPPEPPLNPDDPTTLETPEPPATPDEVSP